MSFSTPSRQATNRGGRDPQLQHLPTPSSAAPAAAAGAMGQQQQLPPLPRPLSLQAALSAVLGDLMQQPVPVGGAVVLPGGGGNAAAVAANNNPNPFAPIGADGGRILVEAPAAATSNIANASTASTLHVPNPLLLQVLPPRMCANAASIAAHKGEQITRLVVVNDLLGGGGADQQQQQAQQHSIPESQMGHSGSVDVGAAADDAHQHDHHHPHQHRRRRVIVRSMYQVGSHYNLYPTLYCSCSAFRYHTVAPNTALTHLPSSSSSAGGSAGGFQSPNRGFGSGAHNSGGGMGALMMDPQSMGVSNSMYCKHLAAVAMVLGPSSSSSASPEASASVGSRPDSQQQPPPPASTSSSPAAAAFFPKDKLVNINNPLANNNTQRVVTNGGGYTRAAAAAGGGVGDGGGADPNHHYALGQGASSYLMPQLVAAASTNNNNARSGRVGSFQSAAADIGSHNRLVMGVTIEDKVISAEEFARIWGSELF